MMNVIMVYGTIFKTFSKTHLTMKKFTLSVLCAVTAIFLLDSCVAKRKYLAQRKRADANQTEINALNKRIGALNDSVYSLSGTVASLNNRVGELGYENQNATNQLNMTKEQVAAQRARLRQMQNLLDQQQKAVEDLRKKVTDALTGFNANEITVSMKNGRVYVSMQESLLFPSGSAVVNPKGKEALSKVASVLNNNSDINIDIEGHTDSVDIHNKTYADNWALSVGRATSIARVLIGDYNVSPNRLVASGRSFYDPVATNTTPAGRALNRRTEIILEPKLDELMQLMNTGNTMRN